MLFPTPTFAAFFVVVLAGSWASAGRPLLRKCVLILAGVLFYLSWDPLLVAVLAAATLVSWTAARAIAARPARRVALVAGIGFELAALAIFKYAGFAIDAGVSALNGLGARLTPPVFPLLVSVGVSFFTLEQISYLLDVHRGRLAPLPLVDLATWSFFFPKLLSGPITRAVEFAPQLQAPAPAPIDTGRAYLLLARGLVKKLVVASFLASASTDALFGNPAGASALAALVGVYAYGAQIYADFSGYTDLARGCALLLGFRLPENFDNPYRATSIQDFWSRWHMSLSRWLRDYLFAPLLRRAQTGPRPYLALVGVMLVAGLWHGAGWTFVAFGAVHGIGMALERLARAHRRARGRPPATGGPARRLRRELATFHWVCLGWIFFGSHSLALAGRLLETLATHWSGPIGAIDPLVVLTIAAVLATQHLPAELLTRGTSLLERSPLFAQAGVFALSFVVILALAPATVPAFIYFRF